MESIARSFEWARLNGFGGALFVRRIFNHLQEQPLRVAKSGRLLQRLQRMALCVGSGIATGVQQAFNLSNMA